MSSVATVDDLDTYLGMGGQIDAVRAQLILDLAEARCTAILDPLPASAKPIVLDVARRAFVNPTGVTGEGTGPFSAQYPNIGVALTASDRRELRLLAGKGGAFTIDPTPEDAGTGLWPWDVNVTYLDGVPVAEDDVEAP